MKKQPDGNFITDMLLPFLVAAIFLGGAAYAILKFLRLF